VRRVRGTARTGWPGAGSEDSGDAVDIWSLLHYEKKLKKEIIDAWVKEWQRANRETLP